MRSTARISLATLAALCASCEPEEPEIRDCRPVSCCFSSGYSGPIADLSDEERLDYCRNATEYWGGEGTACRCADGNSVGIPDGYAVDFCVPNMNQYASCGLTVEEAETCADAIGRDECAGTADRVGCEPINACN